MGVPAVRHGIGRRNRLRRPHGLQHRHGPATQWPTWRSRGAVIASATSEHPLGPATPRLRRPHESSRDPQSPSGGYPWALI